MSKAHHDNISFIGDVVPIEDLKFDLPFTSSLVVNLEALLTHATKPEQGKVVLKSSPEAFLKACSHHVKIACLANNHIMDYGIEGLQDTIRTLETAGITWFGVGSNSADVRNAVVIPIGDYKIGFCGYVCHSTHPIYAEKEFAGVVPPRIDMIEHDIIAARHAGAERVAVCLHWGSEEVPYPNPKDIWTAREIAKLGADIIIGHHSHCIQPVEEYNGVPIFFGLGNAVMPNLRVPMGCYNASNARSVYVKRQHGWNRVSGIVNYSVSSGNYSIKRLRFANNRLRIASSIRSMPKLCSGTNRNHYKRYRRACFIGVLRNLFAGFVDRPRLPGLAHFRCLLRAMR